MVLCTNGVAINFWHLVSVEKLFPNMERLCEWFIWYSVVQSPIKEVYRVVENRALACEVWYIFQYFCNKCLTNASSAWLGVCSAIKASTIHTEVKQLACTKCHKAFISIGTLENMSLIMDKGHLLAPCVTNYSKQRWLNKGNRKSSISLPTMWQII